MIRSPAIRRYTIRLLAMMSCYVAALIGANWMLRHWQPEGTALVAIAILPALPIVGVIAVIGMYLLEETDEYIRKRIATAMMVGLGLMLSITTAMGFLSEAGVIEQPPGYWAFMLWCGGWGITQCVQSLGDRFAGQRA